MANWRVITFEKGAFPDSQPVPTLIPEGGLYELKNGVVEQGGIVPYGSLVATGTSISGVGEATYGMAMIRYMSSEFVIIGTSTKLYGGTIGAIVSDISKPGGYSASGYRWTFVPFGDWVIALNAVVAPQVSKGVLVGCVDLGGSPPKARGGFVLNGHLVLWPSITDATQASQKKVSWSGYENCETWATSLATGAGSKILYEGNGVIAAGCKYDKFGLICHENSLAVMYYTGYPARFGFYQNKSTVRNIRSYSAIAIHKSVFFIDDTGICLFDGENVYTVVNLRTKCGSWTKYVYMPAIPFINTNLGIVGWICPSSGTVDTGGTIVLSYNYLNKTFSHFELSETCRSISPSRADFYDGTSYNYCITMSSDYIKYLGATPSVVLRTREFNTTGRKLLAGKARLVGTSITSATLKVGTRDDINDSVTWSSSYTMDSDGYFTFGMTQADYVSFELTVVPTTGCTIGTLEVDMQEVDYNI